MHGNIVSTGPATFILRTEQGEETKTSPYVQARECGYKVREEIQREPLLCHSSGANKGKPILPVGHVVVFANIPRKTAQAGPHAARLDPQTTLFEEDLANDSPYLASPKEGLKTFLEFARRALQVSFPAPPLSGPQVEALKLKVFSDSVIKMVDPTQRRQPRKVGEVAMDHLQEKYAREIGGGHRLLKGVAGSGKTLVLLQRAIYKARYDPSAKRILFTCFQQFGQASIGCSYSNRERLNLQPDIFAVVVDRPGYAGNITYMLCRRKQNIIDSEVSLRLTSLQGCATYYT